MSELTLYTLKTGKLNRKVYIDDEGTVSSEGFKAGYEFVPSPSELAANRDRLEATGTVSSDSLQAREALLNTNLLDNPKSRPQQSQAVAQARQPQARSVAAQVPVAKPAPKTSTKDIRKMEIDDACEYVDDINDEAELDRLLLQESSRKPNIRKSVIQAIEGRRSLISGNSTVTDVLVPEPHKGDE